MRKFDAKKAATVAVIVLGCALLAAPDVLARGLVIDPDGLSWWDQFVAWFTGGGANVGLTVDPNG